MAIAAAVDDESAFVVAAGGEATGTDVDAGKRAVRTRMADADAPE